MRWRNWHKTRWCLSALLLMGIGMQANGQEATVPRRQKIGLALAGGAALGFAHIGVLDWFDKHHIPIDYVAGTSMGGLIGGTYAIGDSPEQILNILHSINWNEALRSIPPYRSLPVRRKEDLRDLQSRLVVGLNGGLQFPSGVSPANQIDLLLSRLALPYPEGTNFDTLPTPFRCLATDMKRGKAVAFKDGSLTTALRATMAIPGVFTPVERDGTLYTDGGTLRNIPTEDIKEMGADIIIAVDLNASFLTDFSASSPTSTTNPPPGLVRADKQVGAKTPSLLDIIARTINTAVYANERVSLKLADIVLTPNLSGLNPTDFEKVDEFAQRGYQSAESREKILSRLALNEADWKAYVTAREARKRTVPPTPEFVNVVGVPNNQAQALEQQLKPFVSKSLDAPHLSQLDRKLTDLTGTGVYESFLYDTKRIGGRSGLRVLATPLSYGPTTLRFGLQIDGADTDYIRTDMALRLTTYDFGGQGTELRTDLRVGSDRDLTIEYYRPFGKGRPFIAPHIGLHDDSFGIFDTPNGGLREATYRIRRAGIGADLGYNTGHDSQLRFGYVYEHEEASVSTGSHLLPSLHGDISALRFNWFYDGQDSPAIPTRGWHNSSTGYWYFHASDSPKAFPSLDISLSNFVPINRDASVFAIINAGTTFGNRVSLLQQFALGGPLTLAAYGPDEFRGNDMLSLNLGYLHRIAELPSIVGGKVMLGTSYQVGGAFTRFGTGQYHHDITAAFLAETLVGPVSIGYAYGETGRSRVYFSIGRLF